jgi:hypothetical protein
LQQVLVAAGFGCNRSLLQQVFVAARLPVLQMLRLLILLRISAAGEFSV